MKVYAKTHKLTKILDKEQLIIKEFGKKRGKKIKQRVSEFKAASNLTEISYLPPPRLHLLSGNYKNCFSVDLNDNWRLIFCGLDSEDNLCCIKENCVSVYIKEVVDDHGN
ncbi:type II toxin-antitoxin system RelE/ParE family toxin [Liquorilactobacillus satsumensis]|uniref:type II toxin-antitoxin system RelE/ParE family toxin n=1 Tax=Liquorilactobacillus TaxID=2767888 RepID=UPI001E531F9D|nr:type II toxin-antitoxin system RelE/ParE family toxin [Liquorilactobacillus satsumensis]MCP9357134.1 type II toxin-antitoxin system RelE/ParE family toxin [Liquorilactobacillus satsumensis]MCP9371081.1 type II toxin-antitoxin system RelE/ParE family toxin [Liquorilactobacillus satsumensis]